VDLHLQHLELFERAARVARVAVPNFSLPEPSWVQVCDYDGPIGRIKVARVVRSSTRVLRVSLDSQDLRFNPRTGELLEAREPFRPSFCLRPGLSFTPLLEVQWTVRRW